LKEEGRQAIWQSSFFNKFMPNKISPKLLEILACPLCEEELVFDEENQELICYKSQLAYKIKDGIPVMLISEARKLN